MVASSLAPLAPIVLVCLSLLTLGLKRSPIQPRRQLLRLRLAAYAEMKKKSEDRCLYRGRLSEDELLSAEEHEVLLGILKKVEAKNGVLTGVWTFLFSIQVAFALGGDFNFCFGTDRGLLEWFYFSMLVANVIFLAFSVLGARQIDNFEKSLRSSECLSFQLMLEMQRELLDDACRKEDYLFISKAGAIFFPIVALLPFGFILLKGVNL